MALNFKTFWRKKSRWSSITKMFGSTELEKLSCYNTHTFYNLIIIIISFLNLILTNSVLFYHLLVPSYCVWIISDLLINLSLSKRINFFLSFTLLCFLLQFLCSSFTNCLECQFIWKLQVIALHTYHVTSTFQNKAIRINYKCVKLKFKVS